MLRKPVRKFPLLLTRNISSTVNKAYNGEKLFPKVPLRSKQFSIIAQILHNFLRLKTKAPVSGKQRETLPEISGCAVQRNECLQTPDLSGILGLCRISTSLLNWSRIQLKYPQQIFEQLILHLTAVNKLNIFTAFWQNSTVQKVASVMSILNTLQVNTFI